MAKSTKVVIKVENVERVRRMLADNDITIERLTRQRDCAIALAELSLESDSKNAVRSGLTSLKKEIGS